MNHPYASLFLMVIFVSVYVFFISNYAYVSALQEKDNGVPQAIGNNTKIRISRATKDAIEGSHNATSINGDVSVRKKMANYTEATINITTIGNDITTRKPMNKDNKIANDDARIGKNIDSQQEKLNIDQDQVQQERAHTVEIITNDVSAGSVMEHSVETVNNTEFQQAEVKSHQEPFKDPQESAKHVIRTDNDINDGEAIHNITEKTDSATRMDENVSQQEVFKRSEKFTINVCCGPNQKLNAGTNECTDFKDTGFDKIRFIFDNYVLGQNMGPASISSPQLVYGFDIKNRCSGEELVRFEWNNTVSTVYFIDQNTGRLLVTEQTTKKSQKVVAIFNTTSFCLDQSVKDGTYIALVCPCFETICVSKCCKKGFYFNTLEDQCKEESRDDIQKYDPQFYNITEETSEKPPYYLIHKTPKCDKPERFIKTEKELRPLYVQENGSLMVQYKNDDKNYYLDKENYCLDMFSSGDENRTSVNGLYCPNGNEELITFDEEKGVPIKLIIPDFNNFTEYGKTEIMNLTKIKDSLKLKHQVDMKSKKVPVKSFGNSYSYGISKFLRNTANICGIIICVLFF